MLEEVNTFIRSSKKLNAVFHFDKALRDPRRPCRVNAIYASGDHLHPDCEACQAIANASDIELFLNRSIRSSRDE